MPPKFTKVDLVYHLLFNLCTLSLVCLQCVHSFFPLDSKKGVYVYVAVEKCSLYRSFL